jgi:hypothetical protein
MNKNVRTQFDIERMTEVYINGINYKILNIENSSNICFLYFSSNDLYFPNTEAVFEKQIIQNNRFEWTRNVPSFVKKVIFLRDITKQWYLTGIGARMNSIEKLYKFLEEETRNMQVICVGSSAGGYAASLFGSMLKASCVFNFSGQFSLNHILEDPISRQKNPTLTKHEKDPNYRKYYSIVEIIKSANIPIFYFYPAKSKIDIDQCNLIQSLNNVYKFPFSTSRHGIPCYVINLVDLFNLDVDEVIQLHSEYQNRCIRLMNFSLRVSGYKKTANYFGFQLPMMAFKKIRTLIDPKLSKI